MKMQGELRYSSTAPDLCSGHVDALTAGTEPWKQFALVGPQSRSERSATERCSERTFICLLGVHVPVCSYRHVTLRDVTRAGMRCVVY
jgi:hypothetical protein